MQTKTRASAVKIYLFFLFISLFAISGCGLDIDFGSADDKNPEVKSNETIMGVIREVVPPKYDGSNFVIKASVVKDGNIEECCKVTSVEDDEFSLEGNLDPEIQFQIFESGNESLPIGTERLDVFPGATIDLGDITIEDNGNIDYDREDVDITFNGEISDENCEEEDGEITGNINVTISAEGSETEVILVKIEDAEIFGEDEPMCHFLAPGREVEVDGKLKANKTVEATIIEIE